MPFLGERLTDLFSHAISAETDCLICSTFFRRILIDAGENPDGLGARRADELIVDFGRALATDRHAVERRAATRAWREHFDRAQIVTLTAFGAMMVATNVVNNALGVPLDGYLEPYRGAAA